LIAASGILAFFAVESSIKKQCGAVLVAQASACGFLSEAIQTPQAEGRATGAADDRSA